MTKVTLPFRLICGLMLEELVSNESILMFGVFLKQALSFSMWESKKRKEKLYE